MMATRATFAPLWCLLPWLALLACGAGCGFGSAGVAAAVGKSDRRGTRVPTQLTLLTPADGQTGTVTFAIGLDVDPAESVEVVSVEYSLGEDVVPFAPATAVAAFPGEVVAGQVVTGSELAARTSKFLTFAWNSHFDLDALRDLGSIARPISARAALRVAIRNRNTNEVVVRTTDEFYLDHSLVATVAGGGVGDGANPATATMLDPVGVVTVSPGEVYVADSGNHRVRKVAMRGTVARSIETTIGNGFEGTQTGTRAARLSTMRLPTAVAADANANLFIAERGTGATSQLVAYERRTALLFDLLGGFNDVSGLHMTPSRQLLVADRGDDMVWRLDLAGVDPFLDPPAFADLQPVGSFVAPAAVTAVEAGGTRTVYVATGTDRRVVRVRGSAAPEPVAGGGTGAPAIGLDARTIALQMPAALAATPTHVFVADRDGGCVLAVDATTFLIANLLETVFDTKGSPRALERPAGLALDEAGLLFVVETGSGSVAAAASGHQVLVASSPAVPADAAMAELAAGGSTKQVTQAVAEVRSNANAVVVERTTFTG